jgi:membrane-bound lytic murein transglycosylase F
LKNILAGLLIFLLVACDGSLNRALPFPTPAQQDLIVLTTTGPLTYNADETSEASGLEHDLIEAFAKELGVGVEYRVTTSADLPKRIAAGEAHLAIGWLDLPSNNNIKATPPILQSRDILIQHEATLPISEPDELHHKTIHALSGSRQLNTLRNLQKTVPGLKVVEVKDEDIFDLLESVADQEYPLAVIDSTLTDIATQLNPSLQTSLELSGDLPIVWWLGEKPNIELLTRLNAFVEKAQHDGTLARIEDRYFGHVRRLKQADIIKFLGRTETVLPKLRPDFIAAQSISGIDWRLIAAVAYHESQWESEATSPTGVRGIMMLTEETADRLGVKNRLDPRESILAGARYINILKDLQPDEVREPDRTWLALAAYNIGPGNFNAARTLAKQLNADPTAWYEMKRILPLLAKPNYYQRLKSGRVRGGEAVILVENIRSYYDILVRNESAFQTQAPRMQNLSGAPGLKLKR